MSKPLLFSSVFASTLAFAGVASAQQANPNCPPGSWFCADTQQQSAAPAGQPVPMQPPPPVAEQRPPMPPPPPQPNYMYGPGAPPPVVIYQPPPPVIVYQGPRYVQAPPPPVYYYRPQQPLPQREWGINLRVEGAALGHRSAATHDSGMGGVGFGLRYKPIPAFGLEAGVDYLGGRDYNGFKRDEAAFTLNALVFLNPRSRAQVYLVGGVGWSTAHVTDDLSNTYDYSYFGGQGGLGIEFRVGRHVALNFDALGFIRERVDQGANAAPEFKDPATGQTTNTSGGVLFRGGLTFYF